MKRSIRKQFTYIFIGMMVATVAACWLLNTLFLEVYYQREKQKNLLEVYHSINEAIQEGVWKTQEYSNITLMNLCSKYGIAGIVIDIRTQEIISFGADEKQSHRQLWDNLIRADRKEGNYLLETQQYRMTIVKDQLTKTDYVEVWGNLSNGDVFLLRTALDSIRESVSIANRFLAYVGIMASVISGIFIWFLTRKYTEPMMELVKISKKMAALDFGIKYRGNTENEIDILGQNINDMSEKLEKTISELKTLNVELTKDIENKEKLEEMRMEFLSGISHELKTPIALIQGYAEGLKDGVSEHKEEKDFYCDVIIDEATKMNEMVKKLIILNHLEYDKERFKVERINLSALLFQYITNCSIYIKQSSIFLTHNIAKEIYAWGNEFKIEEVIDNFFMNAFHHVKEDSFGKKRIQVTLEEEEKKVRVSIYNSGDFIPEESLERVWEKFYKVDKARTREYGGSGIGLSIVKAIMEALEQNYGVENKENGVLFWFELEKA